MNPRQSEHTSHTTSKVVAAASPRSIIAQITIIAAILAAGYVGAVQPARSELSGIRAEADLATSRTADAERIRPLADRYHASKVEALAWIDSAKNLGTNTSEITTLLANLEELAIQANLHVEQISPAIRQSQQANAARRQTNSTTSQQQPATNQPSTNNQAPIIDLNACEIRVRGQWPAVLAFVRLISEQGLTTIDAVRLVPIHGGDGRQVQARISTRHAWIRDPSEKATNTTTSTKTIASAIAEQGS